MSPRSFQSQASVHHAESRMTNNMDALYDHDAGKDKLSACYITDPCCSDEQFHWSHSQADPVSLGGNLQGGTGIKIFKRQPRNHPGPENLPTQGTAVRRIRLKMDSAPMPVCGGKSGGANGLMNEEQEESVVTEVRLIN